MKTFRHGTHPAHNKFTENVPLKEFKAPHKLYVSLSQHIGAPASPVVAVGDYVKAGTLLGKAASFVSANVHSPVSGTVTAIVSIPTALGSEAPHIEIENDFKDEKEFLPKLDNPSKEKVVERIKEAGIVGMGGATFPAHVKYSPNKPVDILLINAAECEPYITCDHRLMLEHPEEILRGVGFLMTALGVDRAVIGVEENKRDAAQALSEKCPQGISVEILKTKYPQGAEKQLIYALTKRKVPSGGLPMDAGVVVSNVHTAFAVARAMDGEPLYRRAMTVSGDGVEYAGNYWMPVGVTFQYIYDECRGSVAEEVTKKVINGGPMMGVAQPSLKPATVKGTSSLLFLSEKAINTAKATQCINCARCVAGCPMNLLPYRIEQLALAKDFADMGKLHVSSCIECGVCTFVCPAKRPLMQAIRLAKKTAKDRGIS